MQGNTEQKIVNEIRDDMADLIGKFVLSIVDDTPPELILPGIFAGNILAIQVLLSNMPANVRRTWAQALAKSISDIAAHDYKSKYH